MASHVGLIGCLIMVVALLEGAAAVEYTVGGSYGWAVPPSDSIDFYANWTSNKAFQIRDTVVFNWTGNHTAVEVSSKEYYDNCTKNDVDVVLATSGVHVHFNSNGTLSYICSVGNHCEQGQKVTFVIGDGVSAQHHSSGSYILIKIKPK